MESPTSYEDSLLETFFIAFSSGVLIDNTFKNNDIGRLNEIITSSIEQHSDLMDADDTIDLLEQEISELRWQLDSIHGDNEIRVELSASTTANSSFVDEKDSYALSLLILS